MSKIQVGYDMLSKHSATKIVTKMQTAAKKDARLGRFEVERVNGSWKAFHILTPAEKVVMEVRCATQGHKLHTDGYCLVCHEQVEPKREEVE